MANEVTFGYRRSKTLTFAIYTLDGTVRETGSSLTETPAASGLYLGSPALILAGDLVIIREGTTTVGWGEYQPQYRTTEVFNIYEE